MRAEQERCSARLTTRKLRASWKPPSGILAALPVMLSTIYLSSIRLPVFKTRLGNFSRTLFHEAWNSLHSSVLYTHKSLGNHVSLRTTHAWSPRKAARVVSVVFAGKKFARCNNISRLDMLIMAIHVRGFCVRSLCRICTMCEIASIGKQSSYEKYTVVILRS